MKADCVARTNPYNPNMQSNCVAVAPPYEKNKGKIIGAGLGATGSLAYIIHDSIPLLSCFKKTLGKIKIDNPNTTESPKDIFCSYLTKNPEIGKKVINKAQLIKRAGLMAGIVTAGIIIGTLVDKITESKANKK